MKKVKIVSLITAVLLVLNLTVAFAANTKSAELEGIVSLVKQKVDVDDSLKEFNVNTATEDGNKIYNIIWNDEYDCEYVNVTCDDKGRISNYSHHGVEDITEDKETTVSYSDAVEFADKFMHRLAPELFENENDCLVIENKDGTDPLPGFSIIFNRLFNGIRVEDNSAAVDVCAYGGKLYVTYAYIEYDYDANFEDKFDSIENYSEAYMKAFPAELIYKDINSGYLRKNNKEVKTALLYRCKDNNCGYILASDGSVAEKDIDNKYLIANDEMAASSDSSGSGAAYGNTEKALSEEEIAEIKNIAGLIDENKALEIAKKIPGIKIDNELKLTRSSIGKYNDNYYIYVNLSKDGENYSYASLCLDAKTGKLIRYNCSRNYDNKKELSEAEKQNAEVKINEFLDYVIPRENKELTEISSNTEKVFVSKSYDRLVNGVRYIDDGVYVEYNAADSEIVGYNYNLKENVIFEKPENIIGTEDAYKSMLEINPIELRFIKTGGIYKRCYTLKDKFVELNAFTGEKYEATEDNAIKCEYKDINGHWAEGAVRALAEKGIAFSGEYFCPDDNISQKELLKLFAAGIWYTEYLNYDSQKLYGRAVRTGIITKSDISENDEVKRGDSFKYLIRMAGLENIASLPGIFKVEYADKDDVSDDLLGYAAILSGMKVIGGDGGYVRPNDSLTRAEAATMLYNYLNNEE